MATVEEMNTCSCQTCDNVRKTIDQTFKVLDIYKWLIDAYIVVIKLSYCILYSYNTVISA